MPSDRSADDAHVAEGLRDVHLRDLAPDDAEAVKALILAGLAQHWGTMDESLNPDLDDLAAAHPGSRTVVACDREGRIIGTGTVIPRDATIAEIVRMSTDAAWRGRGVGRLVLSELVATARSWGAARVVLETTATWTATVAFYERHGFRVTHHEDGPFGLDAWFERRLDEA
jgi:GNAT superfamily N-acetyltransferase